MQTRRSTRRGGGHVTSTPNPSSGVWLGPGIPLGGRGATATNINDRHRGQDRPVTVTAAAAVETFPDFGSDDDILPASPIELRTPNGSSTPVASASRPRRGRRPNTAAAAAPTPILRDVADTAPIPASASTSIRTSTGIPLGGRGAMENNDNTPKRNSGRLLPSSRTRSSGTAHLSGTPFVPASALLRNMTSPRPNPSPAQPMNDSSLVDDSFLFAVDHLEKQMESENIKSSSKGGGGGLKGTEKVEKENHVSFLFPAEKMETTNTVKNATASTTRARAESQDMFDDSGDEHLLNIMPESQKVSEPERTLPDQRGLVLNSSRSRNVSGGGGFTYGMTTRKRKKSGTATGEQQAPIFLGPLLDLKIPDPRLRLPIPNDVEMGGEPQSKKKQYGILGPPSASQVEEESEPKSKAPRSTRTRGKGEKKKKKPKFKLAYTNRKNARILSSNGNNELSQAKEDLSTMREEDKLLLSSWGLPHSVVEKYRAKGVTSLFPWQFDCLSNIQVLEGRNLLYSAPTSAGKTLVAEILMVKRVIELGKKAIMILPFISVCREKMYGLQEIFGDAGIRVEGFMGGYSPPGGFKAVDIAICTIEKANSLINRLLEDEELSELGTVVVDELHLIGDPHRGYLLELLLTKIRFMTEHRKTDDSIVSATGTQGSDAKKLNIQVIGMSATLPNLTLLSSWMDAELQTTDYRPVPLVERICYDGKIYDRDMDFVRNVKLPELPVEFKNDSTHLIYLSLETVLNGHSVLIFCPTKRECETTAKRISDAFQKLGNPNDTSKSPEVAEVAKNLRDQLNGNHLKEVLTQLEQSPAGVDKDLKEAVKFAVAFHHAGLTYDERDIIESSFKRCVIRVIVATSTLSAGVNLPARRVIISSPLGPMRNVLDSMAYHQMCGRAGRKGVDTEGESILICPDEATKKIGMVLATSQLPFVKSALLGNGGDVTSSLKRALLEVVVSGIATQSSDVDKYSKCTLLSKCIEEGVLDEGAAVPTSHENKDERIKDCLEYLKDNQFIRDQELQDGTKKMVATPLGSACLASSLLPGEGITVYKELLKARGCFVLSNDLHVIYQVTPIYLSDQLRDIKWLRYLRIYQDLTEDELRVAEIIGVTEGSLVCMLNSVSNREKEMIHQRFYAALALNDLVSEKSISFVADKYELTKGVVQNLQQSASTFAGMVTSFCGRLKWGNLELLLSQFQERLQFGVQRELCDLVRLSTMNGQRARVLYDNGITTIPELAASDPAVVEDILHKAAPFISTVHGEGAGQARAKHIWVLGKTEGLSESEASKKIVEEARQFVQMELGTKVDFKDAILPRQGSKENSKLKLHPLCQSESSSDDETDIDENDQDQAASVTKTKSTVLKPRQASYLETLESLRNVSQNISRIQVNQTNNQDVVDVGGNDDVFINDVDVKPVQISSQDQMKQEFMEIQGMLSQLVETSMDISDAVGNKENFPTPNSSRVENENVEKIRHSTPGKKAFFTSNIFVKNRLSSIPFDSHGSGSPVAEKSHKISTSTPKNQSENAINTELLAELSKDFDSVAELMEISLNISDIKNNDDSVPVPDRGQLELPQNHHKLSESDAAAALAIANDSKFDSEDLFADFENKPTTLAEATAPHSSKDLFDDEETQFPALLPADELVNTDKERPGPSTSNYRSAVPQDEKRVTSSITTVGSEMETTEDEESSVFENYTETASAVVNSPPVTLAKADFGEGRILTVKKILSPDLLPEDLFQTDSIIGLSFQLTCPKPSLSSGSGVIGARIIGAKRGPIRVEYSIALYKGGLKEESIWVYGWIHAEPQEEELYASNRRRLTRLLQKLQSASCTIVLFDAKDNMRNLVQMTRNVHILTHFPKRIIDPYIAHWMIRCENETVFKKRLEHMMRLYPIPENKQALGLNHKLKNSTIVESFIGWNVIHQIIPVLKEKRLWSTFTEIEMPSIIPLLFMECNGVGLDSVELSRIKTVFEFKKALLELHAFQMAGKSFTLAHAPDVDKILFQVMGLTRPPGTKGASKDVLKKLDHDIVKIIIDWRKVTSTTLEKVVVPFEIEKSSQTQRLHSRYSHFNLNGRVTTLDKTNLQCAPNDFDLLWEYSPKEVANIIEYWRKKQNSGPQVVSLIKDIEGALKNQSDPSLLLQSHNLSIRSMLVSCNKEFVLVAADYSQIELRVIAHFSGDNGLKDALNGVGGKDVFKSVASRWKKLPYDQITASIRSDTKALVYGLNYGLGDERMAEDLGVSIEEAKNCRKDFLASFKRLHEYIKETKDGCRKNGYIETISGRRRYFPDINSNNRELARKAGRQAINSQIQGSASELVKVAMIKVHAKLAELYPKNNVPINWAGYLEKSRSLRTNGDNYKSFPTSTTPSVQLPSDIVCFPVLNIHDELIFEVRKTHLYRISMEIRDQMESAMLLSVPTPVVIKQGPSWGNLSVTEYSF